MLQNKSTEQKAYWALAWVCFFWGTTWIASKIGVGGVSGIQLVAIRQLFGGLFFISFFIYKKHAWPKGKQWQPILVTSLLNFIISNCLSTWAVQYISSGLGSIIGAIFPLWMVIIALFTGEKIPTKAILGLLLGFGGICVIFLDHLSDFLKPEFVLGITLSIIATISWSLGSVYTKKYAINFNPYFSLGLQMFISSIVLHTIAYSNGLAVPFTQIPEKSWWAIFYLVVIGSILTFTAFMFCLQYLPTTVSSLYGYVNPIVAVLLGALILNEKLNAYIAIGGGITIFGIYLVNNAFKRNN
jgi:drug/metabolite transporter (DMT)-like permease